MVAVVSSNPTMGNYIFLLKLFKLLNVNIVQKCQVCVENENHECKNRHNGNSLVFYKNIACE